jgi:hypothetical protein
VCTCQLPSNNKAAVLEKALNRHTAASVMLKAVGYNGICNLVTDFVGMSCGYLFGCDNFSHSLFPPDKNVIIDVSHVFASDVSNVDDVSNVQSNKQDVYLTLTTVTCTNLIPGLLSRILLIATSMGGISKPRSNAPRTSFVLCIIIPPVSLLPLTLPSLSLTHTGTVSSGQFR